MKRSLLALLLALAACSQPDNVVLGGISPGPQTPLVVFDNISSAISGPVQLTDSNGNPTLRADVVIISNRPGLCDVLKANPSYFRSPPEAMEALIIFMEPGFLGTFVIGRGSEVDNEANSEIIATGGAVLGKVSKGVTNQGAGTLRLSGSPASGYPKIVINITGSGEPGAAMFQYSLDGGATFSPDVAVPASGGYALDPTGVTVTFQSGASGSSFAAGDTFSFGLGLPAVPFTVLGGGSYIGLTHWDDGAGGNASGTFDLFYANPTIGGVFEFTGKFNTEVCPTLDGVLLP